MNKKLFSAVLMGALLLGGTFVSCQDYDDDIDNLQNQVNGVQSEVSGLKASLGSLESKVNAGKYITSVSKSANGVTLSLNDGSTVEIANGKDGAAGAAGKDGKDGTVISITDDGFFVIDGDTTAWKAAAATAEINMPKVVEGEWYFYDEEAKDYVASGYRVAPVVAVENADKSYTLTVYNADGTTTEVKVPTAASSVTDLVLLDANQQIATAKVTLEIAKFEFNYQGNDDVNGPKAAKWKGQKAIAKKGFIYSATNSLYVQVNPTTVDATDLTLKLVDSKNGYANLELEAEGYNGYVTRAANANGIYEVIPADKYVQENTAGDANTKFWKAFKTTTLV